MGKKSNKELLNTATTQLKELYGRRKQIAKSVIRAVSSGHQVLKSIEMTVKGLDKNLDDFDASLGAFRADMNSVRNGGKEKIIECDENGNWKES